MRRKLNYRWTRIYFSKDRKHHVQVRVYGTLKEMQEALTIIDGKHVPNTKGAHQPILQLEKKNKKWQYVPITGLVFLNLEWLNHSLVAHEFNHAVLWAWKHHRKKVKQYPIVINTMEEEEEILTMHTYAIQNFYSWALIDQKNKWYNPVTNTFNDKK